MVKTHSTATHVSKALLTLGLFLTLLYGLYQYLVAEWTTATLWTVASLLGMIALFAKNGKMVLAAMALYLTFMFAAFICHICFISLINRHTDDSYPPQSMLIEDNDRNSLKRIIAATQVLGIIFSILLGLFMIPLYLALARALKHDGKKYGGTYNNNYNQAGNTQPLANQGNYREPIHQGGVAQPSQPMVNQV
eukprot:NODE_346_length_9038_cov_0.304508.p4 type:complete len:193 gc:universal NODE_346_length_9038_cov_0.304508:8561-7983(-)